MDIITAANSLYLLCYFVCNLVALKNPIFFFYRRLFSIMCILFRFCIAQEFISYYSVCVDNTHFFFLQYLFVMLLSYSYSRKLLCSVELII